MEKCLRGNNELVGRGERSRKAQRIAPRAVISIGALISKRHPNIEQPPEDLKQADAVLIKELDEIVYSRGLDNRLSLNTILYAMGKDGDISDIYKYSHLARKIFRSICFS